MHSNSRVLSQSTLTLKLVSIYIFGMLCFKAAAQPTNLGTPQVTNFYKNQIGSGTQTWDIAEDSLGYIYFANNKGMLVFDGFQWELFPLENKTIVRSVMAHQGRIYVGGQGDFGYYEPNKNGVLVYHSLMDLVDDNVVVEDVWDILLYKGSVFFRTDNQVFRYESDGSLHPVLKGQRLLVSMEIWGEDLVIQDADRLLFFYEGNGFVQKPGMERIPQGQISAVIDYYNDTTLIMTINHGIYFKAGNILGAWPTGDDEMLKKSSVYEASITKDGDLLLATTSSGLVVLDRNRRVRDHFNKQNGMQNNTVLSIYTSRNGIVWLGLDNGIDCINFKDPFTQFFPDGELEGSGYAAVLYQKTLYFGTNTGLYSMPWKEYYKPLEKKAANLISGTDGQVWSLNKLGESLLVGQHSGAYQILGGKVVKVSDIPGIWKFILLDEKHAIAGHYKGLAMFSLEDGLWKEAYRLTGFEESSRIMALDEVGNLWIAHPYRGVYKIPVSTLYDKQIRPIHYSAMNGLKNSYYHVNKHILFYQTGKWLQYIPETDKVQEYDLLNNYMPADTNLLYLQEDDFGNIWYGSQSENGLLVPDKAFIPSYKKFVLNQLQGFLPEGFESFYTIDHNNVIIPTQKGFLLLNPAAYLKEDNKPEAVLSKMVLHQSETDSTLYTGLLNLDESQMHFELGRNDNSISFFLNLKDKDKNPMMWFSYYLEGGQNQWSRWSNNPQVSFTELPPGEYVLRYKVKNQLGVESEVKQIHFNIAYPWYRGTMAVLIYLIAFAGILWFSFKKQKNKFETEKSILIQTNKKREEETSEEIIRLQNEKLVNEINHKNQELTSFTYHLVNKNELINEIQTIIEKIDHKLHEQPEVKKELKQIKKLTEQNIDVDANWESFIKSFDQVHTNFYKRLNEEFSELSPNDYKMCTYLRMNLSSKEIAALMNISIRSVETNRYRLRKKMDLDSKTNLSQFLINY